MKTKFTHHLILSALIIISFISCNKDDDSNNNTDTNNNNTNLVQFTPDQADWNSFATKALAPSNVTSHDPDGIGWISQSAWNNAKWDGTIYDPTTMTKEEFYKALFPTTDTMRGLREVFYEHNPFADNENPTKAEVDEWHRIALNHLRALVGYTSEDRKVKKDHCMFQRALWGQQRKFTTMWDDKYPGTQGSAYGPCKGSGNQHCGSTFVPDAQDQMPYLSEGQSTCGTPPGAEGVTIAPKSNIPWSIKWIRGVGQFISSEGFWGGHVGPFFHREKFGFSFWDNNTPNNNATLRAKWTGKLMPNLYEKP